MTIFDDTNLSPSQSIGSYDESEISSNYYFAITKNDDNLNLSLSNSPDTEIELVAETLAAEMVSLTPQNEDTFTWDVDGNGKIEANRDGLLIYGYLNVRNIPIPSLMNQLATNLADPNGSRNTGTAIASYLQTGLNGILDVDGNGKIEANRDGLLLYGYLNVRNIPIPSLMTQLINNLADPNSSRTPSQIVAHLDEYADLDRSSNMVSVSLSVIDGDLGENDNSGQIRFSRTGSTNQPLTVSYSLDGDAIHLFDYSLKLNDTNLTNSLTFAVGESSKTVNVNIFDDNIFEFEESIEISLDNSNDYSLGNNSEISLSIADNETFISADEPEELSEDTNPTEESGDYIIDAMLFPNGSNIWTGKTVTYSFLDRSAVSSYYYSPDRNAISEMSDELKGVIRTIIEEKVEPYVNLDFVEVNDSANSYGDIRYMLHNKSGYYAYAYASPASIHSEITGDIHLAAEDENSNSTYGFLSGEGSYGYRAIIHETLHAIGLKHPGDYNGSGSGTPPFLPEAEDNTGNSIMSYHSTRFNPVTPMIYDIKALENLYGEKTVRENNTTYTFSRVDQYAVGNDNSHNTDRNVKQTILDSGGVDTVDFSNLPSDDNGYRFDLNYIFTSNSSYNTDSYQHRASGKKYNTSVEGTFIAEGVVIENLINSSSDDTIFANSGANIFSGYSFGTTVGDDIYWNTDASDTLDLFSYTTNQVTRNRSGNDEIITLGVDGSITIKDYYSGSRMKVLLKEPKPVVNLSVSPTSIVEDEREELVYTFTRTGSLNSALSVGFSINGTANFDTDYVLSGDIQELDSSSGIFSFAPNETTKTIRIETEADGAIENDETIILTLLDNGNYTRQTTAGIVGTIIDDDQALPSLSINDVTITEGDSNSVNAVFTVTMTGTTSETVSVDYRTVDDDYQSAKAGSDYTSQSGTLTFTNSQKTQTITVPILGGTTLEGTETFFINLSNPINALITDGQGKGTIIDNDTFTGDVGAPVLNGVQIKPDIEVDISSGSAEVEFIVSVRDDFSGIDSMLVTFESPSGNQDIDVFINASDLISGTDLDGTYQDILEIPQFSELGVWTLQQVFIQDKTGNSEFLQKQELTNLGFNPTFTVTGTTDTEAPVLEDITIPTGTVVDTSAGSAEVELIVNVSDNLSGIDSMLVTFASPSESQDIDVFINSNDLISGTNLDGTYQGIVEIPQFSELGVWTLESVFIDDKTGNIEFLQQQELTNFGFNPTFTVTGTTDTQAPVLENITIEENTVVDTSGGSAEVELTVNVTDNLSGIDSMLITFESPSGNQDVDVFINTSDLISGTDLDGTYQDFLNLPQFAESGVWNLEQVFIQDKAGNIEFLPKNKLITLGFDPIFQVTNSSLS